MDTYSAPKIITIQDKKLVGQSVEMSLLQNKTFELFSSFMPNRKQITNRVDTAIYEVLVYDSINYFSEFNPNTTFEKWATVEVSDYESIPETMNSYNLQGGLYAVFIHKGLAEAFSKLMQFIFWEWFPKSEYVLDDRAHFLVLGDNYKKDSPDSEETVYIPIRIK